MTKRTPIQLRVPIISDKQHDCPYDKPFGYIYLIRNKINGHMYIGKHEWHKPFIDNKYWGSGYSINSAYKIYGKNNFDILVLQWVDTNKDDLNSYEKYWIDLFGTFVFSQHYNLTEDGDGWTSESLTGSNNPNFGNTWTDKQKSDLSIKRKKYYKTHRPHNYGKSVTEEQRQFLIYMRSLRTYCKHSEETKHKISKALKGKPHNYEPWNKGKPMSDEQKQKLSESCKGRNIGFTNGCCICKPVVQLDIEYNLIRTYSYINEAKQYGFPSKVYISECCKHKKKYYKGYIWMYMEEYNSMKEGDFN